MAPKLCQALGHNTHITSLDLSNSNLQKTQGPQLAESLAKNSTLKQLNVESNFLDPEALTVIAVSLTDAPMPSGSGKLTNAIKS